MDMKSPNITLIAALALALASCSFSTGTTPEKAGEELIEGALGEHVGLLFVDANCEAPADRAVGTPFTCIARTEASETVMFDGVMDPDDSIFIAASNIIAAEEMAVVETEAAGVLGEDIGVVIDPSDVDCPDQTTVLDDDVLRCEITDTASGDRYEMFLTVGGFELREGFAQRSYEVGDKLN
jgi:hypothetical protein